MILLELFCDYVLDRDKLAAKVKLELFEQRPVQAGKTVSNSRCRANVALWSELVRASLFLALTCSENISHELILHGLFRTAIVSNCGWDLMIQSEQACISPGPVHSDRTFELCRKTR